MSDLRFGTPGLMWIVAQSMPKERHRDVYGLWRGYTYSYDGADRLVSAVYGETGSRPATLIADSPDYSEYRTYDAGSNLATLKACGLTDRQRVSNLEKKLSFGPVKDIVFENRGAQMLSATVAPNTATVSTMDNSVIGALKESKSVGFNYDAAGRLVEDGLRDESFTYDRCGNPSVAQYSTGRAIDYLAKYSYDATGVLHKRSMAYNYELIYKRDEPLVPLYPDSLRPGYHYPWDSLPPRLDSIITPRPVFPSPVGAQPALSGSSSPQAISVLWPPGNRRDSLGRVDDILARTPHMDYAYCGNYEYRNGSLSRIVTPVGYYEGGRHHYQLNDYQGNVRCVVSDTLSLVSAVHYYPGGSLFGEEYGTPEDKPLFQGSRLESYGRHSFYDLLNRHYDPVLCRFTSIDSKYANHYPFTPYHYGLCNPVRFRDPDGNDAIITFSGRTITVSADIYLMGALATRELANIYQADIMNTWGSMTTYNYQGTEYQVVWDINVSVKQYDQLKERDGRSNYLEVTDNPEQTSSIRENRTGIIRSTSDIEFKFDNPISHELGHILGLKDRYDKFTNKANPGWHGNIMAEKAGCGWVEKRNLKPLFEPGLKVYHGSQIQSKALRYPFLNSIRGSWNYIWRINKNNRER